MKSSVHMFPGQGDFPVRSLYQGLAADRHLRSTLGAVFEAIDEDADERGVPQLGPWLLGEQPPSGRELARAKPGSQQLALFGTCLGIHSALCDRLGRPDAVLGVSFGEIAALTAAGAWTVREGASIVHELSAILDTATGGMTLLACSEPEAADLFRRCGGPTLAVACVNGPDETVACGPVEELSRAELLAERTGIAAVRLPLPFTAHHASLTPQADRFAAALRGRPPHRLELPVYSAVAGRRYTDADLPDLVADCVTRPVRLPDVLGRLVSDGYHGFTESGPGSALTQSVRRCLGVTEAPVSTAFPLLALKPSTPVPTPQGGSS